jgi:hypothetical protein
MEKQRLLGGSHALQVNQHMIARGRKGNYCVMRATDLPSFTLDTSSLQEANM